MRVAACQPHDVLNDVPHTLAEIERWSASAESAEIRCERARETGLWLLSSDVTGERGERISYGPTALIDPDGVVTEQLPLLAPGVLLVDVPTR